MKIKNNITNVWIFFFIVNTVSYSLKSIRDLFSCMNHQTRYVFSNLWVLQCVPFLLLNKRAITMRIYIKELVFTIKLSKHCSLRLADCEVFCKVYIEKQWT